MTQYIDKADATAIRRKVERTMRARADAAVRATVPRLVGVKDEAQARAILEDMARRLVADLDALTVILGSDCG